MRMMRVAGALSLVFVLVFVVSGFSARAQDGATTDGFAQQRSALNDPSPAPGQHTREALPAEFDSAGGAGSIGERNRVIIMPVGTTSLEQALDIARADGATIYAIYGSKGFVGKLTPQGITRIQQTHRFRVFGERVTTLPSSQ